MDPEYDFGVGQYQDRVVEREHGSTDGVGPAQPDLVTAAEKVARVIGWCW